MNMPAPVCVRTVRALECSPLSVVVSVSLLVWRGQVRFPHEAKPGWHVSEDRSWQWCWAVIISLAKCWEVILSLGRHQYPCWRLSFGLALIFPRYISNFDKIMVYLSHPLRWQHFGKKRKFWKNLVGPVLYWHVPNRWEDSNPWPLGQKQAHYHYTKGAPAFEKNGRRYI